jgi:integrase
MPDQQLPVRKYVRVWLKKRKNPARQDGSHTVSYTLEWVEYGQRRFFSLGRHATAAYARAERARKERELNSPEGRESLEPIAWGNFVTKYLDTVYPGHERKGKDRRAAEANWGKSLSSFRSERLALDNFGRIVMRAAGRESAWCREVTSADREKFVAQRIREVNSGESVDADLRNLRTFFNVMEEWKHRAKGTNPFSGKQKATIGKRRKRAKEVAGSDKTRHYTRKQIAALLTQADKSVAENPESWERRRLRALVYFEAYTGARIGEVLHLEWDEVDLNQGIAWLNWKIEHGLKTAGAEAPIGLPDTLLVVLREWLKEKRCPWVFPNADDNPWTTGGPGYKSLDQLKALAKVANVAEATWKMFRHSLSTHGKQWFGLTKEQMRIQLRHEAEATQKHYDHSDLANLREAVKAIDYSGPRKLDHPVSY